MSAKFPAAKLTDIAELNPALGKRLPAEELISFVPMASLSAESASVETTQDRPYAEVAKGFTPFIDGDVLVAKITPCFENGKIAQARLPRPHGFGSTEFHVVRARSGVAESRYLHHYLRLEEVRANGQRRMTGSAGQRRVPASFLADLALPLPPLEEQRRIAAILDQAETLRTQRRTALALLDSLTQSLFLEMFGGATENSNIYPISSLVDLVDARRPISYGILMPGPDVNDGVKYVRVVDMKDGGIRLSSIRRTTYEISNSFKRSTLSFGDLLISIRGHVGRVAVIPPELDGANITQDSARLAITGANPIYVRECLRTPVLQRWMAKHTKGIAVRGINLGDLKMMPIPLPPRHLQDEFGEQAVAIDQLGKVCVNRASMC